MANQILLTRVVLLLVVTVHISSGLKIKEVLDAVPENELVDFIKYHMIKGYNQVSQENTKDIDKFSRNLYQCIVSNITPTEDQTCQDECSVFIGGKCVVICDPGIRPSRESVEKTALTKCD